MDKNRLDRLAILTVAGSQSGALMKELNQQDFRFTIVNTSGGVVQEAVICLLVGFHQSRLDGLLRLVRSNCPSYRGYVSTQAFPGGGLAGQPMLEAELGGALVRVMKVDRFEQI